MERRWSECRRGEPSDLRKRAEGSASHTPRWADRSRSDLTCRPERQMIRHIRVKLDRTNIRTPFNRAHGVFYARRPNFDLGIVAATCQRGRIGLAEIDAPCSLFVLFELGDLDADVGIPECDASFVVGAGEVTFDVRVPGEGAVWKEESEKKSYDEHVVYSFKTHLILLLQVTSLTG